MSISMLTAPVSAPSEGVGPKGDTAAVGALGDGDAVPHQPFLSNGLGHWTVLVSQACAGHGVKPPGHAPSVLAELRLAACKIHTSPIPIGDGAARVRGVDRG